MRFALFGSLIMAQQIEVRWDRVRAVAGYFLLACLTLSVLAIMVTHAFGVDTDSTKPWRTGYTLAPEAGAAPAPYARREPKSKKEVLGHWVLQWYGTPYHYALKPDGTFTHERDDVLRPQDRTDYSGTWRMEDGDLVIDEYMTHKFLMTHRLRKEGDWWVSQTNATTKLVRTP